MEALLHDIPEYVELLPLAAGVVFLLAGWLLYWVSLHVAGAALGAGTGLLASEAVRFFAEVEEPWLLAMRVCSAVVGGGIGVVLVRWLHKAAFFLIGALAGGFGWFFGIRTFWDEQFTEWGTADLVLIFGTPLAALVAGLVSLFANRLLIALASAILGACLLMVGVSWNWGAIPAIPLAAAGFAFQVAVTKGKRSEEEE